MSKTIFRLRKATSLDKEQMLQLYSSHTKDFVGSASRTLKSYTKMLRRKDNIIYVALDNKDQFAGYVHASFEKKERAGEFREIIVDPKHNFEQVATCLIEKVNTDFAARKAAVVMAGSLRNPAYEKIFPRLGFFESASMGVFMYAVLDVDRFLNELKPVFENRLNEIKSWRGTVAIECDEHSLFLDKIGEAVRHVVWTNKPVDFKVKLSTAVLIRLIFGVADPVQCLNSEELKVESTTGIEQIRALLVHLFPRRQFLIMDFW